MVSFTPQFQSFVNSINLPKKQGIGFGYGSNLPNSPGQDLIARIKNRADLAQQNYAQQNTKNNVPLAQDVISKSGGNVPVDQFGMPQQSLTDFSSVFNNRIHDIANQGNIALQTVQARKAWMDANRAQNAAANPFGYPTNSLPAGASPNNPGAQAVQLAMQAYKNKTPYVWGGNSLKLGVDCSGLTQQIYKKLGINIPRSTYEQAKFGKVVLRTQLLPGDLIFYNTGKRDPSGIGRNSHVALYLGNGQVIDAENPRAGIRISNIDDPGQYSMAVQPW